MIVCPLCHREIPDDKLSCDACGANLASLEIEDRSAGIRETLRTRAGGGTRSARPGRRRDDTERLTWQNLLHGFVGGLSIALTKYVGPPVVVPLFIMVVIQGIARKVMDDTKRPIIPTFAIQAGYLVWLSVGVASLTLNAHPIAWGLFEGLYVLTGLVWLVRKPGPGPLLMLGLLQGVRMIDHVTSLTLLEWGTDAHKAVFTHVALRGLALISLGEAYVAMRHTSRGTRRYRAVQDR
jgi:hypothetical protein